jgi:hypothetical protein
MTNSFDENLVEYIQNQYKKSIEQLEKECEYLKKIKKIKKINQIQSLFFSFKSKRNFLNLNKNYENIQKFLRTKIITKKFEETKKNYFF